MRDLSLGRYARSREVIKILKQAFDDEKIDFKGEHYELELKTTDPTKPYQKGGPLLYFGGYSAAKELCAEFCDVYLMWPSLEKVKSSYGRNDSSCSEIRSKD